MIYKFCGYCGKRLSKLDCEFKVCKKCRDKEAGRREEPPERGDISGEDLYDQTKTNVSKTQK
jgi:predicted metal-binding protein